MFGYSTVFEFLSALRFKGITMQRSSRCMPCRSSPNFLKLTALQAARGAFKELLDNNVDKTVLDKTALSVTCSFLIFL